MEIPSSRRQFNRTAAGGVSLAWSGMRITAGSGSGMGPAGLSAANSNPVPADQFLYGSQFYRPPNLPRAMRHDMLRTIAEEYKFNLIRIWPNWDYVNPEPDKWIFDEVEEVMSYCDVIIETGFGLYDENFYYNPTVPPYALDQVFGYREGEAFWLKNEKAPTDVPASDRVYYEQSRVNRPMVSNAVSSLCRTRMRWSCCLNS